MRYRIDNYKLKVTDIPSGLIDVDSSLSRFMAKSFSLNLSTISNSKIISKSIDARGIVPALVYSIEFDSAIPLHSHLIKPIVDADVSEEFVLPEFLSTQPQTSQPLIIGAGPAGLMAAYILAASGRRPIVFERGFDVDQRINDIASFHTTRQFNTESNYLFGEGGAGTFSDGKLYTRIRDVRCNFVLQTFINAGAHAEIAYLKRPHIGSDILPAMVKNIRHKIEELGGEFCFGKNIEQIIINNQRCAGVITACGDKIESETVIIAHGLGGRNLTQQLISSGVKYQLKGFQVGCRIEHQQAMIDRNQYKLPSRPHCLGAAEYNLVSRPPENSHIPGVSTFCMCPGGVILPSTAFNGQLSTNGMSCFARAGEFANSCMIVTLPPELFRTQLEAFNLLTEMERQAFKLGGNDYTAPAQDAIAFVRRENHLSGNMSSYCFGLRQSRVDEILPKTATNAMTTALLHFDKIMPGFIKGKIIGIETFISSPVRFNRNPDTGESSIPGLFIAGEGAGFAGGIMSAAIDGIKTAESVIKLY